MSIVRHLATRLLHWIFWALTMIVLWWSLIDTQPPIEGVNLQVVSFDRASGILLIESSALKNRHCSGVRAGWLRENGAEPPPHTVQPLDEATLPPEGFRGVVTQPGQIIHWRYAVTVPPYVSEPFVYQAQWQFKCNTFQYAFPLKVDSPFLEVKPLG